MTRFTICLALLLTISSSAHAHFPWLAIDNDGKAQFFFGENPAERNYKLPEAVAKADVTWVNKKGKARKVKLVKVETDEFIGMASAKPVKRAQILMCKMTYGMYGGSRLDYYSMHQAGALPKDRKAYAAKADEKLATNPTLDLKAQLVDTDSGVDVFVLWKGKPLANVDVKLFCEEGHEEGDATTDKEGKVSFSDKEVEDGLNGIMVGHRLAEDSGEFGGEKYTSSSHYLTVTFHDPEDFE